MVWLDVIWVDMNMYSEDIVSYIVISAATIRKNFRLKQLYVQGNWLLAILLGAKTRKIMKSLWDLELMVHQEPEPMCF